MENLSLHISSTSNKNAMEVDSFTSYSDLPSPLPEGGARASRQAKGSKPTVASRRKREFISDEKKDDSYWEKRRKNNEAAKRSREKRRLNDMVLENRVMALNEENVRLKTELLQLKLRFGLISTASYMEKSQQIASSVATGNTSSNGSSTSGTPNNAYLSSSGYSSASQVMLNSDSSETEQPSRGERHSALTKYSPRGSVSDLSDGSSRDSPEPLGYNIKKEPHNMELVRLESTGLSAGMTNGLPSRVYHGIHPALMSPHQQSTQLAESAIDYQQEQGLMEASTSTSQATSSQRSVILYRSSSGCYPMESHRPDEQQSRMQHGQHTSNSKFSECSVTVAEVAEKLERTKTMDCEQYEYSEEPLARNHGQQQHQSHHGPYRCRSQENSLEQAESRNPFAPNLIHSTEEGMSAFSQHNGYLHTMDEEPPVLTYEGGPRTDGFYQENSSAKDTSSSDGDPRSSDKEASTDDESPSSSSSDISSYHQKASAAVGPHGESQFEVKATALPHKLRLKNRAMSTGATNVRMEVCMGVSMSPSPTLPQHPYLALPSNSHSSQVSSETREAENEAE
ncbi:nuclear factor, interleukin 3 regulated, member 5 [Syngnathus typhle]|uniref:nuclear factor, interleukin 3 regulated, member 5 n=1 Tax=Syngnathus typhle TaxID=161592 RepID=UPI002A6A9E3C|nr:nuclear factor, interleukin 3 regulated, member 5 [Syngnathus typhle]XP_061130688.1 nuclear factor, interleukin 3 regulated, member 5 [Syngnathus typhle]XP_061130689.1 nuclear factor, interleukin 3 regulated, member 5 [Syngnathus typhle]XP_061130690.1 nuclear factor, interleukin 3 regulated, member 5 [Syngnathus typhle]